MVKITKVYTKQGDKGITSIAGGHKIKKCDLRIQLIGDVDELNANIAFATESIRHEKIFPDLAKSCLQIQNELFNLGASLAVLPQDRRDTTPSIIFENITRLEKEMDEMNEQLPILNSFILPGGSESAARFHIARTVCRRTERMACQLFDELNDHFNKFIVPYLNRLSDWLFVTARYILSQIKTDEVLWDPKR